MGAIFLLGRERGGGRLRRGQDPSLRGKRYMGGNGKVEGRACPAPTDCCENLRTRGAREGGSPPPLQWAGGCPGMDGDARPVGIPQSPNGDSPSGPDPSVAPRHLPTLWGVTL